MKTAALLLAFICCSLASFSQKTKKVAKKPATVQSKTVKRMPGVPINDDSLYVIKKNPVIKTQTNAKSRTTPQRVNSTKLDDLKNPFDTLRSAQPRTVATPRQTARTRTPIREKKLDSLNPVKSPAVIQKQH